MASDAVVYDEADFNREKEAGGKAGSLNYSDDEKQNCIYYGWSHFLESNDYTIGQPLTMELSNGTDTERTEGILKASFGSTQAEWAVAQTLCSRLGLSGMSPGWVWVDCAEEDEASVRSQLEEMTGGMEHVEMTCYQDAYQEAEKGIWMVKAACYLFLAVSGLIGFMNLANTMILNVITKKQEYGILQAAGMTNRQLNGSLQMQGILFSAGTVLVSLAAGLPAGYRLFLAARQNAVYGLNVYHVPVLEMSCMAAAVILLQLVLSYLLSRNLTKESLADRNRYCS